MKIKNTLYVFMLLLFFISAIAYAQEMDALERVYKDQYDKYVLEIKELHVDIDRTRESFDKMVAIREKLFQLDLQEGYYRRRGRNSNGNDGATVIAGHLQKKIDRMKELEEKKDDLKIRVLEKMGSLPGWWID